MTSIRKITRTLALGILVGLSFAGWSEASTISISPSSQVASVGDTVTADILVSGIGPDAVGGVSLFLSFGSILTGSSYTIDPDAKMGFALNPGANDFGSGFGLGNGSPLELFFLADASLDSTALFALQGTGFRVATVSFLANADGFTHLELSTLGAYLSDGEGDDIATQSVNGTVCVGANCTVVPEPSTLTLLGGGLAAALVLARRRSARQNHAARK